MRPALIFTLLMVLTTTSMVEFSHAQYFCDDPPSLGVLTGETIEISGIDSEGHPITYSWYLTAPGDPFYQNHTSTDPTHSFTPLIPGLWSVALVAGYQHSSSGTGLWSSNACVTVQAATVVASIGLARTQIATDESLLLTGDQSRWATDVVPAVEWLIDDLPFAPCNGGTPPSSSADLSCTIPPDTLSPGWHTAGLQLDDPGSTESSLDSESFEVVEIVPLAVTLGWTPYEPGASENVAYVASVTPAIAEQDFTRVTWDLGDGTILIYESCPLYYGSCLLSPHNYGGSDGWYQVSVTVETIDETVTTSELVKVGNPVDPPVASFTASPANPRLLETTSFVFDGSCDGDCQWSWDFGDGSQSTIQDPTHAWQTPATYTVSLSVTNQSGEPTVSATFEVAGCWTPTPPVQTGSCYGGEVTLTAAAGSAWSWNTGATSRTIATPFAGYFWVNIDSGSSCWGHADATVVLMNCGDAGGDTNLDSAVDASDLAALIPELTDGDGDTVVTAGGGDLTAPGGDVSGDARLRRDDLLTAINKLFD